jgi:hypothetical protein
MACTEPQCLYKGALYLYLLNIEVSEWYVVIVMSENLGMFIVSH